MSMQPLDSELLEHQETVDDWGDFSAVIGQLEQQENEENESQINVTETEPTEDKSEAVAGFLDVAFTLTEQITSVILDFEFEFDAKGKEKVIEAAQPVLNKHGSTLMGAFGDYIEEATLIIAIFGLIYTSKRSITAARVAKAQECQGEGGENGQETEAATAA